MGEKITLNRRNVLKTAVGSASLIALTNVGSADDTIEVPVAKHGDEIMKTKKVDRKWWEHTLQARKNRAEVEKKLQNSEAIESVAITEGKETISHHNEWKITVKINRNEISNNLNVTEDVRKHINDTIPQEYNGHVVETRVVEYTERYCNNSGDFDPVPGGVILHPEEPDDPRPWGTFCCPVSHADHSGSLMLATNHTQDDSDKVYQGDNYFGSPTNFKSSSLDFQLISHDGDTSLISSIEHPTSSGTIQGHATNLEALKSDSETILKTGVTTGYGSGQITDIGSNTVTFNGEGAEGDSGAPWFIEFETYLGTQRYLVAMEISGPNNNSYYCDGIEVFGGPESVGLTGETIIDYDDDIQIGSTF